MFTFALVTLVGAFDNQKWIFLQEKCHQREKDKMIWFTNDSSEREWSILKLQQFGNYVEKNTIYKTLNSFTCVMFKVDLDCFHVTNSC